MAQFDFSRKLGKCISRKDLKKMDLLEVSKLDLVKLTDYKHWEYNFYRRLTEEGLYEPKVSKSKKYLKQGWELMKPAEQNEIDGEFMIGGEKYE